MTQKYIRRRAGFGWVKRSYYRLREPRFISALYGVVYMVTLVVSVYNFFDPPRTVVEAADNPLLLWIALTAMSVGGALGVVTVANGRYWVERYAATMVSAGLAVYWLIGFWLALAGGGSRWLSLMTTSFAAMLIALRFYWILDRPYNTRKLLGYI